MIVTSGMQRRNRLFKDYGNRTDMTVKKAVATFTLIL